MFDAGYDLARLAFLLTDLPVEVLGRIRADRVLRLPAPPRQSSVNGRPPKHGEEFRLADAETWSDPTVITATDTTRYGTAIAIGWDRLHSRLTRRAAWLDHSGDLPVLEGTLICLTVERLPGNHDPKPVWLWSSRTSATPSHVDRLWRTYLRRFDLEHTFRLFKQTLGWTTPKLRDPRAADRWTWLIIACYTQLRLARTLAADLRRPWERPALPDRLTPARVRRGFRNIRPKTHRPAAAPKPATAGPGRPPGSKNKTAATRHDVGKTTKTRQDPQGPTPARRSKIKLRSSPHLPPPAGRTSSASSPDGNDVSGGLVDRVPRWSQKRSSGGADDSRGRGDDQHSNLEGYAMR